MYQNNKKIYKIIYTVLIMLIMLGGLLCSGVYFPVINFSPAFLILLILLGIFVVIDWVRAGKIVFPEGARSYILLTISIICIMFFAYLVNGELINDTFILVSLCFLFEYACFSSIYYERQIRIFLIFYVLIVTISCLVQLGQVAGIGFCYDLWDKLQTGEKLGKFIGTRYLLGLATNPVDLGYQVSAAFTIVLTYPFKKTSLIKWLLLGIFAASLWFSQTRSSILAVLLVIIIYFVETSKNDYRNSKWLFKVALLIIASLAIFISTDRLISVFSISRFATASETNGTLARWPMILTAFNHALHHPFGMGTYVVNPDFVIGAYGSVYYEVLETSPHNMFANCVASYGFVGLVVLLCMYYQILKTYQRFSKEYSDSIYLDLYRTVFLCIIALFINAIFHNKYILNSDFSSHYFIGILLSANNILIGHNIK